MTLFCLEVATVVVWPKNGGLCVTTPQCILSIKIDTYTCTSYLSPSLAFFLMTTQVPKVGSNKPLKESLITDTSDLSMVKRTLCINCIIATSSFAIIKKCHG